MKEGGDSLKRYWLKKRVLVWIIAMIIWGILAVAIIIIALLDSEKLAGSVCVLLAWGMLISFVILLFAGKVKIIDPVMRIRLKIELFNDGIEDVDFDCSNFYYNLNRRAISTTKYEKGWSEFH